MKCNSNINPAREYWYVDKSGNEHNVADIVEKQKKDKIVLPWEIKEETGDVFPHNNSNADVWIWDDERKGYVPTNQEVTNN